MQSNRHVIYGSPTPQFSNRSRQESRIRSNMTIHDCSYPSDNFIPVASIQVRSAERIQFEQSKTTVRLAYIHSISRIGSRKLLRNFSGETPCTSLRIVESCEPTIGD